MQKATIKGFFNPQRQGDTFKGLNGSIKGELASRLHGNLFEFLKEGGRNYFIKKVPARIFDPSGAIDAAGNIVPGDIDVENQFHLVRSTDHRIVSPHTVTESYAPLSLMDVAEELQPWCEAGWCQPDGVYSSRNESLEILSLRLVEDAGIVMPGNEKFLHYIVFENVHATGGKAKGKIITWRIVCANTFAAAISARSDFMITHRVARGDATAQAAVMTDRVKEAVAAWEQAKTHIARLAEKVGVWQAKGMTKGEATSLTNRFLDIAKDEDASTRSINKRDAIVAAFEMPAAGTFGRSAWDWMNAVTFVNSSPFADINKKSKVDAVDRIVRTTTVNGTGFKDEAKAENLLAEFIG
jgi:hypothetical protein